MQGRWRIKRWFKSRAYRGLTLIRQLTVALTGFALSLVFVSGPYVQSAFTSFMSGDKATLYGGMFGMDMGTFPSVGGYIRAGFSLAYLLCGVAVASAMVCLNSKRSFLIWVGLVTAAGLTAVDASGGFKSLHEFAVCLACNILGGAILSLVLFVVATNVYVVRHVSGGNKVFERILWCCWPAFCLTLFTGFLFFVLAFLIKIPSATISLRIDPPVSGYVSSVKPMQCEQSSEASAPDSCEAKAKKKRKEAEEFDVLRSFSPIKGAEKKWVGLGKSFSVEWKKRNSNGVVGAFRLAQGCTTRDQLAKILKTPAFKSAVSMQDFQVAVDDGLLQFRIIDPDYTGQIKVRDQDWLVSQFWVVPSSGDSAKLSEGRFVSNGSLTLTDQFRSINYEIGLSPYGKTDDSLGRSRRITLRAKGGSDQHIDVKFDSGSVKPNSALNCKELKPSPSRDGYVAVATEPLVSILVSIEHADAATFEDIEKPDVLQVDGINGWISSDGNEKASLDEVVKTGKIGMLSVFGAIKDLQVNDKAVATGPTNTLQLWGDLLGRTDGTSIIVTGDADYMLLNDRRMTSTRWEGLDTTIRVPVIFAIPTALIFLLNLLRQALARPMRRVWWLPK